MEESVLRQALGRLETPTAVLRGDGSVGYANDAWTAVSVPGSIPTELDGSIRTLSALPTEAENARRQVVAVLSGDRETAGCTYACPQAETLPRWFSLRANGFERDGERYVVVEQVDITESKRTEQELAHRTEVLAAVAKVVSHDIRNPMTAARSWTEVLGSDPAVDDEMVDRIIRALDRMNEIVTDAVMLARETSLEQVETVAIEPLATTVWTGLGHSTEALTVEKIPPVLADERLFHSLFENIFTNSVQHGGSDVRVRVGPLSDGFFIEDDGSGIDPSIRAEIFDAGVTTRSSPENTGLGLTIVERIVAAHGWEITLADSDTGVRFEIRTVHQSTTV